MKVNSKKLILKILKNNQQAISGEIISNTIGVSRTAVWKNIKSLISDGYTINSSVKGYLLKDEKDLLIPYEFDNESNLYICRNSSDSTMLIAKDLIYSDKAVHGTIIVSEKQISPRGKGDSGFKSPIGGLYFTIILKPNSPVMDVNLFPIATLVAIKKSLNNILGIEITNRWPFDTYFNGDKISGILHEYETEQNRIKWLTVGVGINLSQTIPRKKILTTIKAELFKILESENVISSYKQNLDIVGRSYNFDIEGKTIKGEVIDIDRLGTVTIKTDIGIEYGYIGNSSQKEKL